VGTGHGLIWECGQALSMLRPEQFVILVLDTKLTDYRAFASEVESQFTLRLPEVRPTSLLRAVVDVRENPSKALPGVILFSSGWRPEFRPLPFSIVRFGNTHLRRAFAKALEPVFEARSIRHVR
jgi:hypothetical protein